jgi:uncharacterized phiE125 gp8 family phage protein
VKWVDIPWASALSTAPAVEPLTFEEVKAYLRLPDNTDLDYVTGLITAARQKVESDTGRRLITQSWTLYADAFPEDAIVLPWAPLLSVTSIKTTTSAGVQSTLAATHYQVDTTGVLPRIWLADAGTWPGDLRAHQGIEIIASVGYGAAGSAVPGPILEALRMAISIWYASRAGAQMAPAPRWLGYDALLAPYRIAGFA